PHATPTAGHQPVGVLAPYLQEPPGQRRGWPAGLGVVQVLAGPPHVPRPRRSGPHALRPPGAVLPGDVLDPHAWPLPAVYGSFTLALPFALHPRPPHPGLTSATLPLPGC